MGKRSRMKKEAQHPQPAPVVVVPKATPNWPMLVLAICGFLLTSYLTWTAFRGSNVKGCAVGAGCDVVLTSKWARILGLPTSFWGLLTYLALVGSALWNRAKDRWRVSWIIATLGLMYSVYLTTISLTI